MMGYVYLSICVIICMSPFDKYLFDQFGLGVVEVSILADNHLFRIVLLFFHVFLFLQVSRLLLVN